MDTKHDSSSPIIVTSVEARHHDNAELQSMNRLFFYNGFNINSDIQPSIRCSEDLNESTSINATPIVIAESAMLNAGQ